jgi:hypothetical protein
MVIRLHTTTTCRQLGNDTTYDTEKKNPTSHDVADTSAVSGRRVGKTRHHVVKTNCGRHLKRRHFQLSCRHRHREAMEGRCTKQLQNRKGEVGRRHQQSMAKWAWSLLQLLRSCVHGAGEFMYFWGLMKSQHIIYPSNNLGGGQILSPLL